jgi:hypothetical protein
VGGLLPPQFFVPVLPNVHIRPQSMNHFHATIRELLPEFCKNEKIEPSSIEIVNFADGVLMRLGCHVLLALGSMRNIVDYLPTEYLSKLTSRNSDGQLARIVSEKTTTQNLIKDLFEFKPSEIKDMNFFRVSDVLWEGSMLLNFSLAIKGIDPSLQFECIDIAKETITKALTDRFKQDNERFSVSVDFQKIA